MCQAPADRGEAQPQQRGTGCFDPQIPSRWPKERRASGRTLARPLPPYDLGARKGVRRLRSWAGGKKARLSKNEGTSHWKMRVLKEKAPEPRPSSPFPDHLALCSALPQPSFLFPLGAKAEVCLSPEETDGPELPGFPAPAGGRARQLGADSAAGKCEARQRSLWGGLAAPRETARCLV